MAKVPDVLREHPGSGDRNGLVPERPRGPSQDELLDEALKETFPASDPISVYRRD
jgi:hypothetical protein